MCYYYIDDMLLICGSVADLKAVVLLFLTHLKVVGQSVRANDKGLDFQSNSWGFSAQARQKLFLMQS